MNYRNLSDVEDLPILREQEGNTPKPTASIDLMLCEAMISSSGSRRVSQRIGRAIWLAAIRTSQNKVQRRPLKSGHALLIGKRRRRRKLSLRTLRRLSVRMLVE